MVAYFCLLFLFVSMSVKNVVCYSFAFFLINYYKQDDDFSQMTVE